MRRLISMFLSIIILFSNISPLQANSTPNVSSNFPLGLTLGGNQISWLLPKEINADPSTKREILRKVLAYFMTGLSIPQQEWWANLNALIGEDLALGNGLQGTLLGKTFLEADLYLKKRAIQLLQETFTGIEDLGLGQSRFRLWIQPKEVVLQAKDNKAYIDQLKLEVLIDGDDSEVVKRIKEEIIDTLTKEVNQDPEFQDLRTAMRSLALAKWYKETHRDAIPFLSQIIDSYRRPLLAGEGTNVRDYLYRFNMLYYFNPTEGPVFSGGVKGPSTLRIVPAVLIPIGALTVSLLFPNWALAGNISLGAAFPSPEISLTTLLILLPLPILLIIGVPRVYKALLERKSAYQIAKKTVPLIQERFQKIAQSSSEKEFLINWLSALEQPAQEDENIKLAYHRFLTDTFNIVKEGTRPSIQPRDSISRAAQHLVTLFFEQSISTLITLRGPNGEIWSLRPYIEQAKDLNELSDIIKTRLARIQLEDQLRPVLASIIGIFWLKETFGEDSFEDLFSQLYHDLQQNLLLFKKNLNAAPLRSASSTTQTDIKRINQELVRHLSTNNRVTFVTQTDKKLIESSLKIIFGSKSNIEKILGHGLDAWIEKQIPVLRITAVSRLLSLTDFFQDIEDLTLFMINNLVPPALLRTTNYSKTDDQELSNLATLITKGVSQTLNELNEPISALSPETQKKIPSYAVIFLLREMNLIPPSITKTTIRKAYGIKKDNILEQIETSLSEFAKQHLKHRRTKIPTEIQKGGIDVDFIIAVGMR